MRAKEVFIPGNSIISTGMIAYSGPFTAYYRLFYYQKLFILFYFISIIYFYNFIIT